jgi:hypothetical protein
LVGHDNFGTRPRDSRVDFRLTIIASKIGQATLGQIGAQKREVARIGRLVCCPGNYRRTRATGYAS